MAAVVESPRRPLGQAEAAVLRRGSPPVVSQSLASTVRGNAARRLFEARHHAHRGRVVRPRRHRPRGADPQYPAAAAAYPDLKEYTRVRAGHIDTAVHTDPAGAAAQLRECTRMQRLCLEQSETQLSAIRELERICVRRCHGDDGRAPRPWIVTIPTGTGPSGTVDASKPSGAVHPEDLVAKFEQSQAVLSGLIEDAREVLEPVLSREIIRNQATALRPGYGATSPLDQYIRSAAVAAAAAGVSGGTAPASPGSPRAELNREVAADLDDAAAVLRRVRACRRALERQADMPDLLSADATPFDPFGIMQTELCEPRAARPARKTPGSGARARAPTSTGRPAAAKQPGYGQTARINPAPTPAPTPVLDLPTTTGKGPKRAFPARAGRPPRGKGLTRALPVAIPQSVQSPDRPARATTARVNSVRATPARAIPVRATPARATQARVTPAQATPAQTIPARATSAKAISSHATLPATPPTDKTVTIVDGPAVTVIYEKKVPADMAPVSRNTETGPETEWREAPPIALVPPPEPFVVMSPLDRSLQPQHAISATFARRQSEPIRSATLSSRATGLIADELIAQQLLIAAQPLAAAGGGTALQPAVARPVARATGPSSSGPSDSDAASSSGSAPELATPDIEVDVDPHVREEVARLLAQMTAAGADPSPKTVEAGVETSMVSAEPGREVALSPFASEPGREVALSPFAGEPGREVALSPFAGEPGREVALSPFAGEPGREVALSPFASEPGREVALSPLRYNGQDVGVSPIRSTGLDNVMSSSIAPPEPEPTKIFLRDAAVSPAFDEDREPDNGSRPPVPTTSTGTSPIPTENPIDPRFPANPYGAEFLPGWLAARINPDRRAEMLRTAATAVDPGPPSSSDPGISDGEILLSSDGETFGPVPPGAIGPDLFQTVLSRAGILDSTESSSISESTAAQSSLSEGEVRLESQ